MPTTTTTDREGLAHAAFFAHARRCGALGSDGVLRMLPEHVPLLIKAASLLDGVAIDFDFYGLPRSMSGEAEAKKWGVNSVPTSIVLVDGAEVGRIPSSGWSRPENAIATLLAAPPAAPAGGAR